MMMIKWLWRMVYVCIVD